LQATKENYACTDSEAKRLSEKNLLIACVKESDYQASQASISALAMGLELQVLHGKLSEMKIVLQDLEGKFMAEKSRADIAEAGSVALAKENSKLNDEVARLQVHMDEIQKCLDEVQREKLSAADLVTSTTKNINSLTEQLVNERQRLHKQISSLVKDNHDLTMKYSETKNKLQDLSSKHGNDPMKEIKREEIFKGNLEDLKVRLDESTGVDVHSTDLNQMLHLGEKELQEQDMVSENLLLRGGPRSLGDFEESLSSSYLKDMKTKSVSECQPVPVSDLGTVVNVKFSRPIIPDIKIMLVVVAVSVIIGLVIGRNY
jgi:DNA repair exonuclease SbcCD ATPase subunit